MIPRVTWPVLGAVWTAVSLTFSAASGEAPSVRSLGAELRLESWTIEQNGETVTLSQRLLPIEGSLEVSERAAFTAGVEMSGVELDARKEASASGPAGGWLEIELRPGSDWLLAAGGAFPMRSNSLTLDEGRLVGWLEETGLQMPASGLAFAPTLEIRAAREIRLPSEGRLALAAGWIHRASYILYEDEATLDPGSRFRAAGAYEAILGGGRLQSAVSFTRETFTRIEEQRRYREGDRTRIDLRWIRPGPAEWDFHLGSLLQADGEGADAWDPPAGGSVVSGGVSLRGGLKWGWVAGVDAWRSGGFDDLLGDLVAVRPEAGVARAIGAHRLALSAAPAFGFGEEDLSLRGWRIQLGWSFVP